MFLGDMDIEAYQADMKTMRAVERELQIITEAAIRLGAEAEAICPGPDWQNICGMGNFLRHEYHHVDDKIVWNTVNDDLPTMREAVVKALSSKPKTE